jgi:hypothetical protein
MQRIAISSLFLVASISITAATAAAAPAPKVLVCHKFGTPAQQTLEVAYAAAVSHVRAHGDFLGACPETDAVVDLDGIATPTAGSSSDQVVQVGDPLTSWPTGFGLEGIDWFDNDGTCTWTMGDDLHLEDPFGACTTAIRDGLHNVGFDCDVLDLDGSFFDGQQVDVDLESGTTFTGCPGPDPLLKFHDANFSGLYENGEDIVLDADNDGIFD